MRTVQQETARPPWDSPRRCPASPCPSGSPANLRGQAGGCLPSPPQRRTRTRRALVACSTSPDSGSTELVYRGSTGHLPGWHRSADRRIPRAAVISTAERPPSRQARTRRRQSRAAPVAFDAPTRHGPSRAKIRPAPARPRVFESNSQHQYTTHLSSTTSGQLPGRHAVGAQPISGQKS